MPYSITTKDGITIDNIPDDVSPDDPSLKAQVASMRSAKTTQEEPTASLSELEAGTATTEGETTLEGLMGGITRGAGPVAGGAVVGGGIAALAGPEAIPVGAAAGAGSVYLSQLIGDPTVKAINSLFGTNYSTPTESWELLFDKLGVAQPKTTAERLVKTAAAGASGAGGTVGLGRAIESAATGQVAKGVGSTLASQPVQQLAGGIGAGVSAQAAEEAGLGPMGQLGAGLAGGVLGAKLAGTTTAPRATDARIGASAEAEKRGIPVMTSDVVPPGTFASKWLQSMGEKIPLAGTGKTREVQQAARADAVRDLLLDFGADDATKASSNVMADLAKKRSSDLTKYSTLKNEVIDRLNTGEVPVIRSIKEIDDQIAKLSSLRTESVQPAIARLEDFKASIQGQGLRNIEELRKQLGESFKAPELTSVRDIGDKAISSIYGALRKDMGDFIKYNGQLRDITKWEVANKRLSGMAGELKMGTLKSVLSKGDATPEVVNNMLFSSKPSEVEQLYKSLTPKGRASAQVAILSKAAEKAGGIDNISPDKFANEVNRLGKSVGVFFSGDDLDKVKGLVNAIDLTKRAGQAGVAPPTGVQVAIPVGAAVLTDILGGAGAATATGLGIGGLARIYESPSVRNLLVKIPKVAKGSKEEAALVKRLIEAVQSQKSAEE